MGHFSERLSSVAHEFGSPNELATRSDVARSTIWRFMNAKMLPDADSLNKLLRILPDETVYELLKAYILDTVPEAYHDHLAIGSRLSLAGRINEEPDPEINLANLRPKYRAMIKEIYRLCLASKEIADAFLMNLRVISPEWAREQDKVNKSPAKKS